jgi:serine/threonine protein kinase
MRCLADAQPEIQLKTPLSKHAKQPFHAIVPKAPRDGTSCLKRDLQLLTAAINLIEHLLQFEPTRRYDAHQSLAHQYFTAGPIAPPTIPASVSSSTASLALPPRVAQRASQASQAVQQQQQQAAAAAAAQQQQQQQQQALLAQQQQQHMMMMEQARAQQAQGGYYGSYDSTTLDAKLTRRPGANAGCSSRADADGSGPGSSTSSSTGSKGNGPKRASASQPKMCP